jgi:hypothetical protein
VVWLPAEEELLGDVVFMEVFVFPVPEVELLFMGV